MNFFKRRILVNGGLAFVLLGFLFATVPFFQIYHTHDYSNDNSKVNHIKTYEANCCTPIKIQSHFNGILTPQEAKIKLTFIDNYSIDSYNYSYNKAVNLTNKAPPLTPIV